MAFGEVECALDYAEKGLRELRSLNTAEYRENEFLILHIRILLAQNREEEARPLAEKVLATALHYRGNRSREPLRAMELLGDTLRRSDPVRAAGYYKQVLEALILRYPEQTQVRNRVAGKWKEVRDF